MLALTASLAPAAHSPAFFWSGEPGRGLATGGDYLHEVTGQDLQRTVAAMARGTSAAPLLPSAPTQAPEVQVVFLHDELSTEDVRTLGGTTFPKLQKLMADSPSSLAVPFTTRSGAPLAFDGATHVPVGTADQYLANFPALATNGKTDTMVVHLPSSVQAGKQDNFESNDEVVSRVTAAVAKATGGNYVAMLTGVIGSPTDVEHVTMRRRLATTGTTPCWTHGRPHLLAAHQTGLPITPNLMAALIVSFLLIIVFLNGFCCLYTLQTPKKFDEVKQQ